MNIELENKAKNGDAISQYKLALNYYNAVGVKQDVDMAFYWAKKSANQNYARAQYILGALYMNGEGTSKNKEEALKYFKLSAAQGNQDANNILAKIKLSSSNQNTSTESSRQYNQAQAYSQTPRMQQAPFQNQQCDNRQNGNWQNQNQQYQNQQNANWQNQNQQYQNQQNGNWQNQSTTEVSTSVKLTTKGRISRGTFWKYILISFGMIFAGSFLSGILGAQSEELAVICMLAFTAFSFLFSLFGYIRRLHDLDQSGFLVLLNLIPFVNFIMLIYCGCVEGTKGANKYGRCSNCQ